MSARWIAGGGDYRVCRINQTSLAVGESAFVEELQKQVMHLRMRFLALIEQRHAIRPAADAPGELGEG